MSLAVQTRPISSRWSGCRAGATFGFFAGFRLTVTECGLEVDFAAEPFLTIDTGVVVVLAGEVGEITVRAAGAAGATICAAGAAGFSVAATSA
jgi:hypothetical protein